MKTIRLSPGQCGYCPGCCDDKSVLVAIVGSVLMPDGKVIFQCEEVNPLRPLRTWWIDPDLEGVAWESGG